MLQFEFLEQLGAGWGALGTDIRDLTVLSTSNGPVILASTGPGGGLMSLSFDDGTVVLADTAFYTAGLASSVTGSVALINESGQNYVVVSTNAQGAIAYQLGTNGDVQGAATLSFDLYIGNTGPAIATSSDGFVYSTAGEGLVQGYAFGPGGYQQVASVADTQTIALSDPVALEVVEVAGVEFLVALSAGDTGLTVFEIAAGGALTLTGTIGVTTGLGLMSNPTGLQIVEQAGETYVLVSSAADSGMAGALSVLSLSPEGQLKVTDHILDSLDTRFGTATAVEVITVDDWTYVVAGGGDAGLSLFALAPGGRLLHLDTIVDTFEAGLETISALTLIAEGDDLSVLAASQASSGLAQLSVDLSQQGLVLETDSGNLTGQGQNDLLVGGIGANLLRGQGGDDILLDGFGADTLWGGSGADVFALEADGVQDEIRDFEPGEDRIDLSAVPFLYDASALVITERSWGAELRFPAGEVTSIWAMSGGTLSTAQILAAVEWGVDRPPLSLINQLIGNEADNTLVGTDGIDLIQGLGANDNLLGMAGDDQIDGGSGSDTLDGGDGQDTLIGGANGDMIVAGGGDDDVFGNGGQDTIRGGDGLDTLVGGNGNDNIRGGDHEDVLTGDGGDDSIRGQNGNDTLNGGADNDSLEGGKGNDLLMGDAGDDSVEGGAGRDTLYGDTGDDTLKGGQKNDILDGGTGNDTLVGNGGKDTIEGGDGNDSLTGGAKNDVLTGGSGSDTLKGGKDTDELIGGGGADTLYGGDGQDTMRGGPGDDRIVGEAGRDLLTGGNGADVFVFAVGSGRDQITDFVPGQDMLELDVAETSFGQLQLSNKSEGVRVSWEDGWVLLEGLTSSDLNAGDFIFV